MSRQPILGLVAAGALLYSLACGSQPTTPGQPLAVRSASASIGTTRLAQATDVIGQSWKTPVTTSRTFSMNISPTTGSVIHIPTLGLSITIPANAVNVPTKISVTAIPGSTVAFDFQPAGITFKQPLTITQDLRYTQWKGLPFSVVYFNQSADVTADSHVKTTEIIPTAIFGTTTTFEIWHFSGYALAAGRY